MDFMLIRMFFIYFSDFRGIFCVFDDFVLLAQMGTKKTPST